MSFGHFRSLVKQADELGATEISPFGYGEPLLDSDIRYKIALCTDMGLSTFITTNASLLDVDKAHALLHAGLSHIRFSVHSIHQARYEKAQPPLKFDEVMRNIYNFIAINHSKFYHSCKVSVTVVPMPGEIIQEVVDFWLDKVDDLEIWNPHNWVTGRKYRHLKTKRQTCGRPSRGPVQIQADGTMIPCCFLTNSEFVLGSTYLDPIKDILTDWPMKWLQTMHNENRECYPCMNCDQYYKSKDSPLLYSSRDPDKEAGRTSSTKFNLKGD
jgi:hypothetical protein